MIIVDLLDILIVSLLIVLSFIILIQYIIYKVKKNEQRTEIFLGIWCGMGNDSCYSHLYTFSVER